MTGGCARFVTPCACRHCGSDYHWDNNCPPFKADGGRKGIKQRPEPSTQFGSAYKKAYEALQMGTTEEFSVAYTACVNYSDGSTGSKEGEVSSPKDNVEGNVVAYAALVLPEDELSEPKRTDTETVVLREVFDPP